MNEFFFNWHYACGGPVGSGLFKTIPEDFRVVEELPFVPDGEGEHLLVMIEKKGHNTDWVAGQLARCCGLSKKAISYAGRKDRQGITRQWFCLSLPGMPDPQWSSFETETLTVIEQARHRRKLRVGALKANHFAITLRDVAGERRDIDKRLSLIAEEGVPNYFGSQRFGHNNRNIEKAVALFGGSLRLPRNKRSMYLSAARSWLFNKALSDRIAQQKWQILLSGDVLGFQGNNSLIFDISDKALKPRFEQREVCPTGPLWGRGRLSSSSDCHLLESAAIAPYQVLCDGLENAGLNQERRVLLLQPQGMEWHWLDKQTLHVRFGLPKGTFATSVLREALVCQEGAAIDHSAIQ
ncbi:tRNA pseudouridine(13) synthase TruD [Candidatus Sororendozoicomonas aggregata]|uniref:tRNA pseudouridine(13) synthase TruD n=1 Tax=Candidatus Sororendozoicomonas aggregata TaxID=3073239 RepID=UPI002ED0C704